MSVRRDIQFLRGIAVLSVVIYHASILELANGFLGVDVFFVISGFLITTLILKSMEQRSFSFARFYLRRAYRLLPALYSTLILTTIAAYVFLTPRQWSDYLDQLFGAISFTSNMVLPYQVGYFEDAAETRPLLHIWSLSLEEQYYFVLPALLAVCAKRWVIPVLSMLLIMSLLLCVSLLGMESKLADLPGSDLAFFSFPARAWELLAGSLLSVLMLRHPNLSVPVPLKRVAVIALLGLMATSLDNEHPRGDAMIAVMLSCLLIAGKDNWLPAVRPIRWVEKVGDWSYSLYLIHWPLLAFAYIAYLGDVPQSVRLTLALGSLLLSYAQYRFVETPLRTLSGSGHHRSPGKLIAMTACVLLVAAPPLSQKFGFSEIPGPDFREIRSKNFGIHRICVLQPPAFAIPGRCKTAAEPEVAVWGDSYAMHLIPGLRANPATHDSIIQLTRSGCSPSTKLVPITKGATQAQQCRAFNARALGYITASASIKYVVMSSPFGYFYDNGSNLLVGNNVTPYANKKVIDDLVATIESIRTAGKTPIIVSPPVYAGFDVGECLERESSGALILGREHCDLSLSFHQQRQNPVIDGLSRLHDETGIKIVWLPDLMCVDNLCPSKRDGYPLYRDSGHLTVEGSKLLLGDAVLW